MIKLFQCISMTWCNLELVSKLQPIRWASCLVIVFSTSALAKDLPGATQTSYGVSSSGAFSFQIPIVAPVGRSGLKPNLSLSFSSGGGNGSVGIGWGVSGLGAITRCGRTIATDTKKGGVLHDEDDKFCLNGRRLKLIGTGTYGAQDTEYRTEVDTFARVIARGSVPNAVSGSAPAYWEVHHKDGMIHEYGNSTSSTFKLTNGSLHSWKLSKVLDHSNNSYSINYTQSYRLPNQISYLGGHKIKFNYENRDDVRTSYVLGQKITRYKRLDSITVSKSDVTIREYNLNYEYAGLTKKSRLTSVVECGRNNKCLPPIDVEWKSDVAGMVSTGVAGYKAAESTFDFDSSSDNKNREITKGAWADVNGDGLVDQIVAYRGPTGGNVFKTYLQKRNSSGAMVWDEDSNFRLPLVLRDYSHSITSASFNNTKVINQGQLVDVNGDGLVDIVYAVKYDWYDHSVSQRKTKTIQETWINKGNDSNPNARKGWRKESATNSYTLPDLIYSYLDNFGALTHYSLPECANGCQYAGYVETRRGRFVDINGDGLVDWVRAYHVWNGTNQVATWINTGTKWQYNATYNMPDVFAEFRGAFSLRHGEFVDVNGDGRIDWVQSYHSTASVAQGGGAHTATWLNTETGFEPAPTHFNLPNMLYENLGNWGKPRARGSFIDVNGDGRRDFVLDSEGGPGGPGSPIAYYGSTNKTWLNTGKGWAYTSGYNAPFLHKDHRYIGHNGQSGNQSGASWPLNTNGFYIDMNRDGLVDFAQSYRDVFGAVQQNTWINTGVGWDEDSSFNTGQLFYDYSGRSISKVRYGDFIDINSDGSPDWVRSRSGLSMYTKLSRTGRADQITKIETTLGVEVSPTFATLTSAPDLYQKGVGTSENDSRHITGAMYVTSELSTSAANGSGYNITKYAYSGAQTHREGRGFLGFKTFESRNIATGITQKNTYRQDYPYTGAMIESIVRETANTNTSEWLSKTTNSYLKLNLHNYSTVFPYLRQSISEKAELDGNAGGTYQWAKTVNSYYANNYGQLKRSDTHVGVSASAVAQQRTRVDYTYHPADEVNWLIGQVKDTVTITNKPNISGTTKTRKDAFTYMPNSGLLETVTREPDSNDAKLKLITTYYYTGYGSVKQEKIESTGVEAETRNNYIVYDPAMSYRLPKNTTNALGQVSTIAYHPQCDAPSSTTAINGVETTFEYDSFCRQISATTGGLEESTEYHHAGSEQGAVDNCGASDCGVTPKFSMVSQKPGQPEVTAFYNAYALPVFSETEGMSPTQIIKQKTEYDSLGRVTRQTQPYFSNGAKYWTENHHDLLNRTTKTLLPYGGAEIVMNYSVDSYKRQQRETINTLNQPKTEYLNSLGQTVEIKDALGNSLTYDYDSQGNLIKTTDSASNSIIVTYDKLGRRTSLDDPDLGEIDYTYDAFGQLRTQKDAKNQTLAMRYDKLGRIKERDVPLTSAANSPVETSYYYYDSVGLNAEGQLHKVKKGVNGDSFNSTNYGYDALGRLDAKVTYIEGEVFEESMTYYPNTGQLQSRGFPSSGVDANGASIPFAVNYTYENGYLSSVSGENSSNGSCIRHWQANEYDALGRVKIDRLGDIISTERTYDQAQGVLTNIRSQLIVGNAGVVQNIHYGYDDNNNLSSRNDTISHVSESFYYDELDRLESHFSSGNDVVTVAYDDLGNITSKSDVGSYSYSGQGGPHAVSRVDLPLGDYDPLAKFQVNFEWNGEQITGQNQANIVEEDYQYDANGNITQQGNRSVLWTTFDKPSSIMLIDQDGTQRGSLIEYDADFNRHYKQEGVLTSLGNISSIKETTYYVGKEYEKIVKQNGDTTHRYTITTGGGTVQIEREHNTAADIPKYLLGDNLGSTNVIVNAAGEVENRLAFDPWGARTHVDGVTSAVNGETNRGYTGHEMDDEVGVINMNARIYDPVLGRFLSADGVLPDGFDMQEFNRYSYVSNNPLKYDDPTGHVKRCLGCAGAPSGGIGGGEHHTHSHFSTAEPLGDNGLPPGHNAAGDPLKHGDSVLESIEYDPETGDVNVEVTTYFDSDIGTDGLAFQPSEILGGNYSNVRVSTSGGGVSVVSQASSVPGVGSSSSLANSNASTNAGAVVAGNTEARATTVLEEVVVTAPRISRSTRSNIIDASVRVVNRGVPLSPHQLQGGEFGIDWDSRSAGIIRSPQYTNSALGAVAAPLTIVAGGAVVQGARAAAPVVRAYVTPERVRSACVAVMLCHANDLGMKGVGSHGRRLQELNAGAKISRIERIRRGRGGG